MSFRDTIRLAVGNLGQAKLRTALTMLGVSIGIASLAGMVSLGVGLEDQLVGRFMDSGMFDSISVTTAPIGRLVTAARGRRGGAAGRSAAAGRGRGAAQAGTPDAVAGVATEPPARPLDDAAIDEIRALENVRLVHPNIRVPVQLTFRGYTEVTTAAGVPTTSAGEGAFQDLPFGRFFENETDDACMLSLDMARRITDVEPETLIGQAVTLTYAISTAQAGAPAAPAPQASLQVQRVELACPIVGIAERESAPGMAGGGIVSPLMIPLAKAKAINAVQVTNAQTFLRGNNASRSYLSVTVRVRAPQYTQDVQDRIKGMGFAAFSLNDALQGAKRAFLVLDIVLSLIGSIALAVSSLGIVNTMVMSILERTREIGIMKAIGGSDADIRRIFLIEASAIGVIGGAAGVVLGWVVGRLINFGANIYIENQGGTPGNLFSMPLWLIGGAIGFSLVVSLLAGSYPARRAARLDPIQALRHE